MSRVCTLNILSFIIIIFIMYHRIYEPAHEKKVLITQATRKGSGKPAHKRSLTKAFCCSQTCSTYLEKVSIKKAYMSVGFVHAHLKIHNPENYKVILSTVYMYLCNRVLIDGYLVE